MHPNERWLVLKSGLALALLACVAVVWTHGLSGETQGKVELYASAGGGKLSAITEELKAYKTKLSNILGKFDTLQSRQSQLRGEEQRLKAKVRQVRSVVHQTRNAITTLQYKVHDMSTEALSDAMFGSRLSSTQTASQDSDAEAPLTHFSATKSGAKARLASKASDALKGKPESVVKPHTGAPVPAVRVVSAVVPAAARKPAQAQAVAPPKTAAAATDAHPPALKAALARAALAKQQQAVQERRMEAQTRLQSRGGVLAERPAAALQQGGGDDEVQAAQARAAQARRMAYMRSAQYVESQQKAAAERQKVYGTDLPQLPAVAPLGPEAAAP